MTAIAVKADPRAAAPGRGFLARNRETMADTFDKLARRYVAGAIDRAAFARGMASELRAGAAASFRFALGRAATPAEVEALNAVLERHAAYLARFVREAGGMSPDALAARARLYAGASVEAAAVGKLAAAPPESRIVWQGPDGGSSCEDCLSFIGRSWTRAEFVAMGARPGTVQCGPNCRCRLEVEAA